MAETLRPLIFAVALVAGTSLAAGRLAHAGTPVIFVVEDPPSAEVAEYLAQRQWTLPVYHDVHGDMKKTFANFGTPAYYVLDDAGRIRFDRVDGEAELIAQVEAVSEVEVGEER